MSIWILGYMGSGTKYVARGVACALTGSDTTAQYKDEGLPPHALRRYWQDNEESRSGLLEMETYLGNLPGSLGKEVYKEEFWTPRVMARSAELPDVQAVYIRRRTLGHVQFMLEWKQFAGWLWFQEGIIKHHPDESLALWPEGCPMDYAPATLAVAHEIQVHEDLTAAKEYGLRVYDYEDLTANYAASWPLLLQNLGISPRREWDFWVGNAKNPLTYPLVVDPILLARVQEVEDRANNLWRSK
jgi:hypothetical protein